MNKNMPLPAHQKSTSKGITQTLKHPLLPSHPFQQVHQQLPNRQPNLRHSIALTHSNRLIIQRREIDCDTERRTDLVLAAVAATNIGDIVVLGDHVALQVFMYRLSS